MTSTAGTTFYQDCESNGCWMQNHAAPFDLLQHAFGGAIRPTDIDGQVERKGYFLTLEWKEVGTPIPTGQRILFENFTRLLHPDDKVPACRVLVVWHTRGNTAAVREYAAFTEGRMSFGPAAATLTQVWESCFNWYASIEPEIGKERDARRRRFQLQLGRMGG